MIRRLAAACAAAGLMLGTVVPAAGPAFAAGAGEAAQAKNWPTERPPRPIAAREVKFPPYAFTTLSNGLQVIAVSHHEQPVVSLRLLVRAGAAHYTSAGEVERLVAGVREIAAAV